MILVFGGTSDSLKIVELLKKMNKQYVLSVATSYGKTLAEMKDANVMEGRLDQEAMRKLIKEKAISLIIDATHPYAVEVSNNAMKAASTMAIDYIRYERPSLLEIVEKQCGVIRYDAMNTGIMAKPEVHPKLDIQERLQAQPQVDRQTRLQVQPQVSAQAEPKGQEQMEPKQQNESKLAAIYLVKNTQEACDVANAIGSNIFLGTGSKTLGEFTKKLKDKKIVARVLPTSEVILQCEALGLSPENIIGMKGPFSEEINLALYKHYAIDCMITKESGAEGGFLEKVNTCVAEGIKVIIIEREKVNYPKVVYSIEQLEKQLS